MVGYGSLYNFCLGHTIKSIVLLSFFRFHCQHLVSNCTLASTTKYKRLSIKKFRFVIRTLYPFGETVVSMLSLQSDFFLRPLRLGNGRGEMTAPSTATVLDLLLVVAPPAQLELSPSSDCLLAESREPTKASLLTNCCGFCNIV